MNSNIEVLPNGQWVIEGDTHISKWSKEWGTIKCDPHLFQLLLPYLEDVKVVWDIGACIGDHTRFYLDEGKHVVAVEPNPLAFRCLQHNCPEAVLLNMAASDSVGELWFATCDNAGASRIVTGEEGFITVRAHPLQDIPHLPAPQFVKIDVEGWEIHALRGIADVITRHRPVCFVEINNPALAANGAGFDDIFSFFDRQGYTRKVFFPANARPADPQYDVLFLP